METKHDILKRRSLLSRRFRGERTPVVIKSLALHARLLNRVSAIRTRADFPALRFLEFYGEEPGEQPARRDHLQVVHETYTKYLITPRLNPMAREIIQAFAGETRKPATPITRLLHRVERVIAPAPAVHAKGQPGEGHEAVNPATHPSREPRVRALESPVMIPRPSADMGAEADVDAPGKVGMSPPESRAKVDNGPAPVSELREEQARRIIQKHENHLSRIVKRSLEELEAPVILRKFVSESMREAMPRSESSSPEATMVPVQSAAESPGIAEQPSARARSAIRMENRAGEELRFASPDDSMAPGSRESSAGVQASPHAQASSPTPGRFARPAPLVHAQTSRSETAREIVEAVRASRAQESASSEWNSSTRAADSDAERAFVEDALKETLRNLPRRDLEAITDRVYRGIERRMSTDSDRRGFRS